MMLIYIYTYDYIHPPIAGQRGSGQASSEGAGSVVIEKSAVKAIHQLCIRGSSYINIYMCICIYTYIHIKIYTYICLCIYKYAYMLDV
jgi:hypothetical protein